MSHLYELTGNFQQLWEMADDPEMDPDTWQDTIEAIDMEIEDKADGYAKIITQLTADAEGLEKEEKRLYARRKAIENSVKRLKENLQQSMEVTGKTKFKTDLFSFNVQKNAPSLVLDVPENEVPKEYLIPQAPKVDKAAMKKNVEALVGICHLQQSQSLRIR